MPLAALMRFAATAALMAGSAVRAVPYTVMDVVDDGASATSVDQVARPVTRRLSGANGDQALYSFTHDIAAQGYRRGDRINSALLTVSIRPKSPYGPGSSPPPPPRVQVTVDGRPAAYADHQRAPAGDSFLFRLADADLTDASVAKMLEDGLLRVTLRTEGIGAPFVNDARDYTISSVLSVHADRRAKEDGDDGGAIATPEPAAALLVVGAVAVLVIVRRRRRSSAKRG